MHHEQYSSVEPGVPSILSALLRRWSDEIGTPPDRTGLRLLAGWDYGFESRRGYGYVAIESTGCC